MAKTRINSTQLILPRRGKGQVSHLLVGMTAYLEVHEIEDIAMPTCACSHIKNRKETARYLPKVSNTENRGSGV